MKDLLGMLKSLDSILEKKRKYQFNQDSDIRFAIIKYGIKRNPGSREHGWIHEDQLSSYGNNSNER